MFITPSSATSWLFHGVWCVLRGPGAAWVVGCTWKGALLGEQHPWPQVPLQDSAQLFLTAGAPTLKDVVNMVVVLGWWLDLVILKVLSNLNNSVFLRKIFQVLEKSCVIEGKGSALEC